MKKIFTMVLFLSVIFINAHANDATFGWYLAGAGAAGSDRSYDVITDASGNIFTANVFDNSVTFNGNTINGNNSTLNPNSLLITKLSPSKSTLWYVKSTDGAVTPSTLATTSSGDLYVIASAAPITGGSTANIVDASGSTVYSFSGLTSTTPHAFVAKFNSSGIFQWLVDFGSTITASALTVDASGDVYVGGSYTASTTLATSSGTISLAYNNTTKAGFIARLSSTNGKAVWALSSSGGIATEGITALATGDDGDIYGAGIYGCAASATPITLSTSTGTSTISTSSSFTPTSTGSASSNGYDIVLVRIAPDGTISYVQDRANNKTTTVVDILEKGGQVYLSGGFISFGGTGIKLANGSYLTDASKASALNSGLILAFRSSDGSDIWQKIISSSVLSYVYGITIAGDGRLYATGYYYNYMTTPSSGTVDFGNGFTITNATNGSGDTYLSSYNVSDGTTEELHSAVTGSSIDWGNSITSYGNNLYLLGITSSTPATFEDGSTYSTAKNYDYFLLNYTINSTTTGINPVQTENGFLAYTDNINRQIVVKNASDVASVQLYDVLGRLVSQTVNSSDAFQMSSSNLSAGAYILRLLLKTGSVTSQKIVVN